MNMPLISDKLQLLIIGNGFDLQAGLKTSYSDYFKYRSETLEQALEMSPELINQGYYDYNYAHPNIWDHIFHYYKDSMTGNWVDVESVMKKFLIDDFPKISEALITYLNQETTFNLLNQHRVDSEQINRSINTANFNGRQKSLIQNLNFYLDDNNDGKLLIKSSLSKFYIDLKMDYNYQKYQIKESAFYDFLFEELKKFEKDFADYVKNQVNQNKRNYTAKSRNLYNKLIRQFAFGVHKNVSLLNFNYTIPQLPSIGFISKVKLKENVHGAYKNTVIFGIDITSTSGDKKNPASENKYNLDIAQFTKTYRKLNRKSSGVSPLSKVDEILFYGHSLGEQDYSYFQSIFDALNLYESKLRLFFYYSTDYDPDNKNEIAKNQTRAVYSLIEKYGETLSNQDHGKNLLHRLKVENRINIIDLDAPLEIPKIFRNSDN